MSILKQYLGGGPRGGTMAQAGAVLERFTAEAQGLTDIGLNRGRNEDFFVFDQVRGIYIVADGLGGLAGGEIASRLAAEDLLEHFQKLYTRDRFESLKEESIGRALRHAHAAILRQAAEANSGRKMGTTVALAILQENGSLWFANVGDSRGYLYRDGRLAQMTKDHSLVEEYRSSNSVVPPGTVAANIVTQALGVELGRAHIVRTEARDNDVILLCSDGLWNVLPDDEMALILRSEHDLRQQCRTLVTEALRAGGEDNTTALLASVTMGAGL